jgi:hypothetical protein
MPRHARPFLTAASLKMQTEDFMLTIEQKAGGRVHITFNGRPAGVVAAMRRMLPDNLMAVIPTALAAIHNGGPTMTFDSPPGNPLKKRRMVKKRSTTAKPTT